jgi:LAS superfamily LD-carboxypeptidase LdcB
VNRANRAETKDYGRKMAIVVLHARGHSFAKIGEAFDISGSRAQQIHHKTRNRLNSWIKRFDEYHTDAEVS